LYINYLNEFRMNVALNTSQLSVPIPSELEYRIYEYKNLDRVHPCMGTE